MTTAESTLSLTDRLTTLERRHRRLQAVLAVFAIVAACLPLVAFASAQDPAPSLDALRAKSLTLVDDKGRDRAAMTLDQFGQPSLKFLDEEGRARLELSMAGDQSLIVMRDVKGHNRVGFALDEYPHFIMHDHGQKARLHMTVGRTGAPSLLFIAKDGTFPAGMGLKPDDSAWLKPEGLVELLDKKDEKSEKSDRDR